MPLHRDNSFLSAALLSIYHLLERGNLVLQVGQPSPRLKETLPPDSTLSRPFGPAKRQPALFPSFAYSHFPLPGTSETQFLNVSLCFMSSAKMVPHFSLRANLDFPSSASTPGSDTCGVKGRSVQDSRNLPSLDSQQTAHILYFSA